MFSKKEVPHLNYDTSVGAQLLKFLSRTEHIENDYVKTHRFVERKDLEWHSKVTEYQREFTFAKQELDEIHNRILKMKNNFLALVGVFKNSLIREDFEKLERKLDRFKLEEFVSRKEFERMLREN